MSTQFAVTLVISKSGRRQQSISAIIRSIPETNLVFSFDSFADAVRLLDVVGQAKMLVLIDTPQNNESIEAGIKLIKETAPQAYCLQLVEQIGYGSSSASLFVGADVALSAGFAVKEFLEAIHSDRLQGLNA
jgi:hypothetical protein